MKRLVLMMLCVSGLPVAAQVRYLALGDSFTCGTGGPPERAFPSQLARLAKQRGVEVRLENVAVNGYSTQDLIDDELVALRTFHPDTVTLAIGANDVVRATGEGRYRANVRRIFTAILESGVKPARVFVLPQPDWSASPVASGFGEPATLRARIEAHNTILKEEATRVGAVYVDLFPAFVEQARAGLVAPDGLHPSAKAYSAWADALLEVMFTTRSK
jgi:lysophospholipase L1-like esterase